MTEFLIVLPVLILLIFGTIQIGLIYSAKNTLKYAAFQSARLAAVNHASSDALLRGLNTGLAPLFTHGISEQQREDGIADATQEVAQFVRITRISPTRNQFFASGFGEYDSDENVWYIPNDNLMYRDAKKLVDGAPIQDANLLKIRVEYCYPLMVPLVSKVVGNLSELTNSDPAPHFSSYSDEIVSNYSDICGSRGSDNKGFIIIAEAIVRMQSNAYQGCEDPIVCL